MCWFGCSSAIDRSEGGGVDAMAGLGVDSDDDEDDGEILDDDSQNSDDSDPELASPRLIRQTHLGLFHILCSCYRSCSVPIRLVTCNPCSLLRTDVVCWHNLVVGGSFVSGALQSLYHVTNDCFVISFSVAGYIVLHFGVVCGTPIWVKLVYHKQLYNSTWFAG